jgi:hypothetical protein
MGLNELGKVVCGIDLDGMCLGGIWYPTLNSTFGYLYISKLLMLIDDEVHPRMTDGSGGDCWSRLYPATLVIWKKHGVSFAHMVDWTHVKTEN